MGWGNETLFMGLSKMIKILPCPYMIKTFSKFFSQDETLQLGNAALRTLTLQGSFKF